MSINTIMWIAFNVVIAALLYIDLGILNKKSHEVSLKEAAGWCAAWISVALLFNLGIYVVEGQEKALEFLTGYIIEYSLSMDNMFVFVMIFTYFGVPAKYQPRILHWGILGAIVMRFILIFAGVALLHKFHWLIYIFGAILVFTAIKMLTQSDDERMDPGQNPVLKLFKKFLPFTDQTEGESFFVRHNGVLMATPLFATLIVIEASDLVFAVDSIPAVLGISKDYFIVYSSNIFAIMGLRALYFLLAGLMSVFRFLKYGISVILFFVGCKMLVSSFIKIGTGLSLFIVLAVLAASVAASLLYDKLGPSSTDGQQN